MTITIKYSREGNGVEYKNFIEIQQLSDYDDIVYINCYNNNLTALPSKLPESLQTLDCNYNNLTSLPTNLPESLQTLDCSYNKITSLPSKLPESLQILHCFNNKLTELPSKLPGSLQVLYCSYNNITSLPSKLPGSLQELYCYYNNLTELPSNLPESLQELYCYNNNLTSLSSNLPESLQKLYCYDNKLTSLPPNLPESLQELHCSSNKITSLPPNLPESLQELHCSYNKLTSLPPNLPESLQLLNCSYNKLISHPSNLPESLQEFNCSSNNLTSLPPNLPESLYKLYCRNNKLTSLPINLHELRNLTNFRYCNNEIEYIPPQTTRFLNRLKNQGLTQHKLYNDGQNVHDHQIQESIRNSTNSVMADKPSITIEAVNEEIVCSSVLTEVTKRLLLEYCGDESIHGVMGITFKELLLAVWSIIRDHKDGNEIIGIMNTEMADADCKCFTGKMSRLINCLNGYDDRVVITMAENDQIGNIIIIEKEKLDIYDIDKHKDNVRLAMEERGYTKETIEEWIGYIE
jgi:Leucine-rich repeat (LRR) protein